MRVSPFLYSIKKVCIKLNFSKVVDIYNKRKMNMKDKQQQFINAWESFLNDVPEPTQTNRMLKMI